MPFPLVDALASESFSVIQEEELSTAHFPRSRGIDTVTVLCLAGEIPCSLLWFQKIASSEALQHKVSEHLET